jgi:hypothetical protein
VVGRNRSSGRSRNRGGRSRSSGVRSRGSVGRSGCSGEE